MPVGVYVNKSGASVARFDQDEYDKFDKLGKEYLARFVKSKGGCRIIINDANINGKVDFNEADCLIRTQDDKYYRSETEIKRDHLWRYIYKGVHFPFRKAEKVLANTKPENIKKVLFFMFKADGTEVVIVNGTVMQLAVNTWPEYYGFGILSSTMGFKVPKHGCHVVYKEAGRGNPEHFASIPYEFVSHYRFHGTSLEQVKVYSYETV